MRFLSTRSFMLCALSLCLAGCSGWRRGGMAGAAEGVVPAHVDGHAGTIQRQNSHRSSSIRATGVWLVVCGLCMLEQALWSLGMLKFVEGSMLYAVLRVMLMTLSCCCGPAA